MNTLKNSQLREEERNMWGCGRSPHPHIFPSLLLAGVFFSALINLNCEELKKRGSLEKSNY
jgi:hypothetical protein